MLFITRLFTAGGSFVLLFFVFWLGGLVLGGAIMGGIAGSENPQNAQQAGEEAGQNFGEKYSGLVALIATGLSGIISLVLTFGGLLPWCRRQPPVGTANPQDNQVQRVQAVAVEDKEKST